MASLPPFEDIIDVNQPSLYICLASIAFNPIFWNIVARNGAYVLTLLVNLVQHEYASVEFRNKTITRIFGGNAYYGCYALTITIFSLGMLRDGLCVFHNGSLFSFLSFTLNQIYRYHDALLYQPQSSLIPQHIATPLAIVIFAIGQTLVISSTVALGITGTLWCFCRIPVHVSLLCLYSLKAPSSGITLASSWITALKVSLSTFFRTLCTMAVPCVSQPPRYGMTLISEMG